MIIKQVIATSFGPFRAQELLLSDRFTVVWGENEAGKSSWHAATYAALCGLRRGQGQPRRDDVLFGHRHRPWRQGDQWKVAGVVQLASGEIMEITWDLDDRVGHAVDELGREIPVPIHDGAMDLSRLLGLDRTTFLATACVRQTELLNVKDNPGALQEHLQRAAATGGADATAAAALQTIDKFRKEHVGSLRSNSTKPWQAAKRRVEADRAGLEQAKNSHQARLTVAARLQQAQHEAEDLAVEIAFASGAVKLVHSLNGLEEARMESRARDSLVAQRNQLEEQIYGLKECTDLLADALRLAQSREALVGAQEQARATEELEGAIRDAEARLTGARRDLELARAARANVALAKQDEALDEARTAVASAQESLRAAEEETARICQQRAVATWAHATRAAEEARRSADRVCAILEAGLVDPAEAGRLESTAVAVATALQGWKGAPTPQALSGPTLEELRDQIARIPAQPTGDLAPRSNVVLAERSLAEAVARHEGHLSGRPTVPAEALEADESELRRIAELLGQPPADDAALSERVAAARDGAAARPSTAHRTLAFSIAGVIAVLGIVLALAVTPAGWGLTAIGLVLALVTAVSAKPGLEQSAVAALAGAEADLERARSANRDRAAAERRASDLGIEPTSEAVRAAADSIATARIARQSQEHWEVQRAAYEEAVAAAERALEEALEATGVARSGDVASDLAEYKVACQGRADAAQLASGRPALEAQLAARETAEAFQRQSMQARTTAAEEVRRAATLIGASESEPERLVESLQHWAAAYDVRRAEVERRLEERREAERLLDGRTPDELEVAAADAEGRARLLERAAWPDGEPGDPGVDFEALASRLDVLGEAQADAAQREAAAREGVAGALARLRTLESQRVPASIEVSVTIPGETGMVPTLDEDVAAKALGEAEKAAERCSEDVARLKGQLQQRSQERVDLPALRLTVADGEKTLGEFAATHRKVGVEIAANLGIAIEISSHSIPPAQELVAGLQKTAEALNRAERERSEVIGRLNCDPTELPDVEGATGRVQEAEEQFLLVAKKYPRHAGQYRPDHLPQIAVLETRITELERRRAEVLEEAAEARGELGSENARHVSVAAAEESLREAVTEYERLERLDRILHKTTAFLETAQEKVHRNIAPRLAATAEQWMPALFGDRYQRMRIDPQHLMVKVGRKGEELRDAAFLSHGTAEQLFLLLRLSLVEHLTRESGEPCPILLDDITAHFDDAREEAVLQVLHGISEERQVVLFTQENAVRRWAEEHLDLSRDALITLQ